MQAPSVLPVAMSTSGWHARLELAYERRGARTVPSLRRHIGPLRVQRHFEPEPGLCEHIIVHPPAGIAGGDRVQLDVHVGPNAMTRLTTPGSTRWYRTRGPGATSRLAATVGQGGVFEWLPQGQIVFDGADALSATRFELAPDATLIAWDVVALGRGAGAQPFSTGTWGTRFELLRDGELVLGERSLLDAVDPLRVSPIGWGGRDVIASFVASGPRPLAAILSSARALPVAGSAGISVLTASGADIFIARLLIDSVEPAWHWLQALWGLVRPELIGREPRPPRIWKT